MRQQRAAEVIAPLLLQGLNHTQIGKRVGLSRHQIANEARLVRDMWLHRADNARDEWRGKILAIYEHVLTELLGAREESKQGRVTRVINPDGSVLERQEPPDPRWLSGVVATAKEASIYLGLREGAETTARVEVSESTRQALAPMSQEAYLAMIATAGGTLSGITAVPPMASAAVEVEATSTEEPPSTGGLQTMRRI